MRLLVTGANGQVGWHLQRTLAPMGEVLAIDIDQVDLTDLQAVGKTVRDFAPDVVVNAAAYTAVDKAESEPELARAINVAAPGKIAEECARTGALMVHYSTDYVYGGSKAEPYVESDPTSPLSVYGQTKLEGDQAIIASGCSYVILRTTWVYDIRGKNFLRTILRLAREKEELRVVGDQFGAPTWARMLAETSTIIIARLLERKRATGKWDSGLYHCTAGGQNFMGRICAGHPGRLRGPGRLAGRHRRVRRRIKSQARGRDHHRAVQDAGQAPAQFRALEREDSGGAGHYPAGVAQPVAACHAGRDSLIISCNHFS